MSLLRSLLAIFPILLAGTLSSGCGAEPDQVPFRLDLHVSDSGGAELNCNIDGEATGSSWSRTYASLDDACDELQYSPIQLQCWSTLGQSFGLAEVSGACCWAPEMLSSPIVTGTVYVELSVGDSPRINEGHCYAQDGTSTHGDSFPDAGL